MPATFPTMQPASLASTAAFVTIVIALCAALLLGVARAGKTLGETPPQTRRWLCSHSC